MSAPSHAAAAERLNLWQAAWVIARRDFVAVLWSRTFLFFLLGPLFPVIVGVLAASVGDQVRDSAAPPRLAMVLSDKEAAAITRAYGTLTQGAGVDLPEIVVVDAANHSPAALLADSRSRVGAVLTGTLARPVLVGPPDQLERWRGSVTLLAGTASAPQAARYPPLVLRNAGGSAADAQRDRLLTAQGAQTLLFLLSMLLAGMVLSNLVEEKGNKIIEVLAAAIPMDAVFLGKLFAMLAISLVGIIVWGGAVGALLLAAGDAAPAVATPAVGWPMFGLLFVLYFASNYLLLGSIFLAIGSLATTVREVQTLSMPVTMSQVLIFFLAGFALAEPDSMLGWAAAIFPLSSPYALLARAAVEEGLGIHLLGLAWQALWVAVLVRAGAALFRRRVMQSGPPGGRKGWWQRLRAGQARRRTA